MTPPCPYCGATARLLFVARDRNRRLGDERFPYHRCTACGLVFLHPIPAELGAYYPPDYYPMPAGLAELRAAARHEQFKLDLVTPFARSGKLLEVGPAFGNFAFLAKEAGFDVEVVEMDARCCAFLREVAGICAMQSADAAAAVDGRGPYDVIALWHVVEHLADFGRTLTALAARVKPGGHLVLAAPNPGALQFDLLGERWAHLDAPRHVVLIPQALLEAHFRALGFSVAHATMTDPGGLGWNYFGWQVSLANLATGAGAKRALTFLGSALTRLAWPFEHNDRKGTAYTLVFRKDPPR